MNFPRPPRHQNCRHFIAESAVTDWETVNRAVRKMYPDSMGNREQLHNILDSYERGDYKCQNLN